MDVKGESTLTTF